MDRSVVAGFVYKKLGSGHWLVYGVTVYITELAIQPKSNSAR